MMVVDFGCRSALSPKAGEPDQSEGKPTPVRRRAKTNRAARGNGIVVRHSHWNTPPIVRGSDALQFLRARGCATWLRTKSGSASGTLANAREAIISAVAGLPSRRGG